MRYLVRSLLLLFFVSQNMAWAQQWYWQNPYPQSNSLLAARFINVDTGWVVGDAGTILRTNDGGQTWVWQRSSNEESYSDAVFLENLSGWVVGGNST